MQNNGDVTEAADLLAKLIFNTLTLTLEH